MWLFIVFFLQLTRRYFLFKSQNVFLFFAHFFIPSHFIYLSLPFSISTHNFTLFQTNSENKSFMERLNGTVRDMASVRMLTYTVVIGFCWFINSMYFYGIGLGVDMLKSIDPHNVSWVLGSFVKNWIVQLMWKSWYRYYCLNCVPKPITHRDQ